MNRTIGRALLLALALTASGCGAISDAIDEAKSDGEETTEATETTVAESTETPEVTQSADASEVTAIPSANGTGGLGNADGTLPGDAMALAGASFPYQGPYNDEVWQVSLSGMMPVELGEYNEEAGSCYILFGTLTPTVAEHDISRGYTAPDAGLIVEGRQFESTSFECDNDAIQAAGYAQTYDADVTVGTSFAFYEEFFIPEAGPQSVDTVVIGDPTSDGAIYLTPDVVELTPPTLVVGDNAFLAAAPTYVGAAIDYTNAFDDVTWEGAIGTFVAAEQRFSDDGGTCMFLLGTVSPTRIDDGLVTSSFDSPDFGLIVDGHYVDDSFFECDEEAVLFAGYSDLSDAEISVGTAYPFFTEFYLPAGAGEIQALVMGDAGSDNAQYFLAGAPATEIPAP